MPKSTATDTALLKLLFNATSFAGIADNTATSPNTQLFVALHTADPGVGGNQATNEVTYTGYGRVGVTRTTGGWTVTGNSVSPNASINFPAGTGGSGTATYASIGLASTGAGQILYSGALNPTITTGNGVTPSIAAGSTVTES